MSDCQSTQRVTPRTETTVKCVMAPVVPLDEIVSTLTSQRLVDDVRTFDASDFVGGLLVEIDIPVNCSHQLMHVFRDLGLYIESVDSFGDHDTLHLRRHARLLERMEQKGKTSDHPLHPSETR